MFVLWTNSMVHTTILKYVWPVIRINPYQQGKKWKKSIIIEKNPIDENEINQNLIDRNYRNRQLTVVID